MLSFNTELYLFICTCVCAYVSLCVPCEWKCLQKPEGVRVPGTKVTGWSRSPDMGTVN